MEYFCHIWVGAAQSLLPGLERLKSCLHILVTEEFYFALSKRFSIGQRCKPIAISMTNVQKISTLQFHQFIALLLGPETLFSGRRITIISPCSQCKKEIPYWQLFPKNCHFVERLHKYFNPDRLHWRANRYITVSSWASSAHLTHSYFD